MVSLSSSGPSIARPGADLIAHVGASARPALIQYHQDGSRTELSGRVLVNWAAKTANLLEHHGIDTAGLAVLDLPVHWLTLAASLGISWDFDEIRCFGDGDDAVQDAALIVTTAPERWAEHSGELIVVTSLTGASGSSGAQLPSHAIDFDDEVASQADQHVGIAPDLITGTEGASLRLAAASPASAWAFEGGLILAERGTHLTEDLLAAVHEQWSRRCPVIMVEVTDAAEDTGGAGGETLAPERVEHLCEVERLGGSAS